MTINFNAAKDIYPFYKAVVTPHIAELVRQCYASCDGDYVKLASIYANQPRTPVNLAKKAEIPKAQELDEAIRTSSYAKRITVQGKPCSLYNLVLAYESRRREETQTPPEGNLVKDVMTKLGDIVGRKGSINLL